jgi:PAS domain S-box-containing protein
LNRLVKIYHAALIKDPRKALALALSCVAAGIAVRSGVEQVTEGVAPFVTLCPAVLLASVFGGPRAGALALVLSLACGSILYLEFQGPATTVLDVMLFVFSGTLTVFVGAILQAVVADADDAARATKESQRRLQTALEAGQLGSVSYDSTRDRGTWSPIFSRMVGIPVNRTGMTFAEWLGFVHPEDRSIAETALADALAEQSGIYKTSYRVLRPDGCIRWLEFSATVSRDGTGRIVGLDGVALDITERRREDERRLDVVKEMHHRVQNVLAVVQALARQTVRQSNCLESFAKAFADRIAALAATHNILVKDHGQGVLLGDLLRAETAPFGAERGTQVSLCGPDLILPPRLITPMGLVIHELTTNAVKYGALADEDGRVAVFWTVTTDKGGTCLSMAWSECSSTVLEVPSDAGFGSQLIARMIENDLNGEVEFQWRSEGLTCLIRIPLGG